MSNDDLGFDYDHYNDTDDQDDHDINDDVYRVDDYRLIHDILLF